jgi:two-component system, chemotaxis family, sensor kinase CheA
MMEIDPETLEIAREEAIDCLTRIESNLLAIERGADAAELVDALFRDAHSVKGASGMVGWRAAAAIAHEIEDRLETARERGELERETIDELLESTDRLRHAVDDGDRAAVEIPEPEPPPLPAQQAEPQPAQPQPSPLPPTRAAMRVDPIRVDRMLDAVGEATLNRRRLEHIAGDRFLAAGDEAEEELKRGERLLDDLQDAVIDMRTLPLSSITGPFPRAVRDLAARAGKEVDLTISGTDPQLDRMILEGISDPLVHLLRNAVAHGIEPPEEREAAGKPRRGSIHLRAEQRGGMVGIEVGDDGRGVSPQLLDKGREDGSLADVLATAGLSTASEVSDLAGRGVGFDAVKSHIESLGGTVEVRSEPGRKTEVVLLLPVTLALLNVLLCERDGQPFGIPVSSVAEVVLATEAQSLEGRARIEWRRELLALSDLMELLGGSAAPLPRASPAVVLTSADRAVAVACDRVLGDRQLVVKSLGPLLAEVDGYLGAGILDDGRPALIVDPNRLFEARAERSGGPGAGLSAEPRPAPKVLVVDDQFSVRQLQRSILEAAGYEVEEARHGREALAAVVADSTIDLVLTDVQMPEMDGFELLRAIRQDDARQSLPVVMVTSKGGEEERLRGAEEGADAYIVKAEFDQQALLSTVARLVGR